MALKWMESFEVSPNNTGKYGTGGHFNVTTGRTGGGGTVNGGWCYTKDIDTGAFTLYHGFAMLLSSTPGADTLFYWVGESFNPAIFELSLLHVGLYVTPGRFLKVTRGKNLATLATSATPLAVGSFYYVELKVKCHDTLGEIELRIDTVPQFAPLTGVDTRNGGAGTIQAAGFSWPAGVWVADDWYICNDQGTVNNSFLGPVTVQALHPSLGNGANVNWTPSTGTDHGALVDETTPNGDTDYVSSNTPGHVDTYNFPDITLPGLGVMGVMVSNSARKTDVGPRTINAAARVGGVNYESPDAAQNLLTAYSYFSAMFEKDPSTGLLWANQAAVNAAEFGAKLVT